jgi:NADH-quinone oxidoreductase subunit C
VTDATAQPRTAEALAALLDGIEHKLAPVADGMPCIEVERAHLHAVLERLRDRGGFEQCTFVTAIDFYPREPRFQVTHQLLSYEHNDRVRVHTFVRGDDAHVPTCADLWPGANYGERECFDLFGITFDGHPDLRRLLMPKAYGHHPLRKDFPHAGIEPDKLYREWDQKRRVGWKEPK